MLIEEVEEGDGDVVVLGAGWVGSRLVQQLEDEGFTVHATNRHGEGGEKPAYFRPVDLSDTVQRHVFDITKPETWDSLPPPETVRTAVLTFPLQPSTIEPFWEAWLSRVPSVVAYSSTSVYQVDVPEQLVDEETPLRDSPRALAEAWLQERGATVLTIAGIFGTPQGPRGVCSCLSAYYCAGGILNGGKKVNMVHSDDILAASAACVRAPSRWRGERINVAGETFLLRDLVSHCNHPPVPESPTPDATSKVVLSERLLHEVLPKGYTFAPPIPSSSCTCSEKAAAAAAAAA